MVGSEDNLINVIKPGGMLEGAKEDLMRQLKTGDAPEEPESTPEDDELLVEYSSEDDLPLSSFQK